MRIGAVFPQTEIGRDPQVIRDLAVTAEALGYSHLMAYDHVLGAVRADRLPPLPATYDERTPFHEPFALFAFIAALTTRIELVTGVLVLPQRQTALVAKQAAEIAILSSGRLRLGVGTGWNWIEYESLGLSFDDRGERLEEQVTLLRRLWTEPVVDFEGAHHRVDRAGIQPLPPTSIPIWFGGRTEVAMRRAARIGDGFIIAPAGGLFGIDLAPRLRRLVTDAGRDAAAFGIEGGIAYGTDHNASRWAEEINAWQDAGADYVCLNTMQVGLEGREHIAALERFAAATKLASRA